MKKIYIKEMSEEINEKKAPALLRVHALTGSDSTSKYNGKSKATCRERFKECDELVQKVFSILSETDKLPSADTEKLLRKSVTNVASSDLNVFMWS